MFKVENIEIDRALLLAPMEDVTDIAFRRMCKEFGADLVYTEFINSDGLIRNHKKTENKIRLTDQERPAGIQIYGSHLEAMVESARIAEEEKPDIIDINAGCWVRKVAARGAGAGLLKDLPLLEKIVSEVVKAVNTPVTVKTRIGWDQDNINIVESAQRIEAAGARALTIHCRTRSQAHDGEPDYSWIEKVKNVVSIPVVLNGGIFTAEDALKAFSETGCDGVMIARGAITHPWIFREAKELIRTGILPEPPTASERIDTALRQMRYSMEIKSERLSVIPFRKHYTGYLKGLPNVSRVRQKLMKLETYSEVEECLMSFLDEINSIRENDAKEQYAE